MKPFSPADARRLEAAEGWLELGNFLEAVNELDSLPPGCRKHPEALEIRWKIFAAGKQWNQCLEVAEAFTEAAPERLSGWLLLAHTLHQLDETEAAYQALLEVAGDFAGDAELLYQLACYGCVIGEETEAREFLEQAIEVGGTEMKKRARANSDLKPLWPGLT